jgi:energy-coupling factor transporter ATP-binding protein EcfA2
MESTTMALFEVNDLTYYYPETRQPALKGLSLDVEEGQFIFVTGPSGSGKTTFARVLSGLVPNFFGGVTGGTVSYKERLMSDLDSRMLHREIGVVLDTPEKQLVMSTVERELAFGPENLGMSPDRIKRRIMETASALGISDHIASRTENLSGGMQQRVALGAVMAMEPRVLILDEPTLHLDPIAAKELVELLKRLRDDLGYTIVLIEQKVETCLPAAERVLFLLGGRLVFDGPPRSFCLWAKEKHANFLPPVTSLFADGGNDWLPLAVNEGRKMLDGKKLIVDDMPRQAVSNGETLAVLKNLSFTYDSGTRALRGIDLTVKRGELLAVLGPNGAGKSTLLKVMCGLLCPSSGASRVDGREIIRCANSEKASLCGYLSQNPDDYLFHESVLEEVGYTLHNLGRFDSARIREQLSMWGIHDLEWQNPRELSAGERQCVALAAATIAEPPLLLLDEPTRGLDPVQKSRLGSLIAEYVKKSNAAAVVVTQDIEFAAEWAARIALFFNGELVAAGTRTEIFNGEPFYSSQISRLFHNILTGVVTLEDARKVMGTWAIYS